MWLGTKGWSMCWTGKASIGTMEKSMWPCSTKWKDRAGHRDGAGGEVEQASHGKMKHDVLQIRACGEGVGL